MKPSASTVASVVIGAPVATLISWLVDVVAHIAMPPHVEAALGAVISGIIGYCFLGGQSADTTKSDF